MNLRATARYLASRWPGVDADDLEQEAQLAKLRGRKSLREAMIDYAHKQRGRRASPEYRGASVQLTDKISTCDHQAVVIAKVDVEALISRVAFSQRQAVRLLYVEGLTESDIADTLKISVNMVRNRCGLGMKRMRQYAHG